MSGQIIFKIIFNYFLSRGGHFHLTHLETIHITVYMSTYVPSFTHWAWDSLFLVPSHATKWENGALMSKNLKQIEETEVFYT